MTTPPGKTAEQDLLHRVLTPPRGVASSAGGPSTDAGMAQKLLAGQNRVLALLATDRSLEDVLTALVHTVEEQLEGGLGSVLTLDANRRFHSAAGPSLDPRLRAATQDLLATPTAGSCGAAATSGKTVVVQDTQADPLFEPWRPLMAQVGLRACWSTPIHSSHGETVLGTFAIYHRHPFSPAAHQLELVEQAAHLACLAIERRRAEEALRERELLFRTLIESAQDIVYSLDVEGRITYVSSNWTRLLGHALDHVRLEPFTSFVHPEDVEEVNRAGLGVIRGEAGHTMEYRVRHADGSWRWHTSTVNPVKDARGLVVGGVGIARDITERKSLQAQLTLAERLASVGTLAAGVAHEINNPLAYVLGNLTYIAGALASAAPTGLTPAEMVDVRAAAEDAVEGSRRVAAIVQELRTFSRDDGGAAGSCDLSRVVDVAVRMVHNSVRHRAVLTVDVPPSLRVRGSEGRLAQVLVNLLVNAEQALPDRETALNAISLTAAATPEGIELRVQDNGAGIPREVLGRVFDPFFTTKPVGVGTGLGLSICHGIVTSVGGSIRVESEPGKGTLITVVLRHGDSASQLPTPVVAPPAAASARVLVVDDEPAVGRAVARSVRPEVDVVWVTSGPQALDLLKAGHRFDAILCDVMMPEMDGATLLAQLATLDPALGKCVGLLTGGAFEPHGKHLLQTFEGPVLHKPFDADAVRAFVQSLLALGHTA